jgi:hypothetical protein
MGVEEPRCFLAFYYGDFNLAKLLVSAGASIDVVDIWGETPTYWAGIYGKPEMIDLLKGPQNKRIDNLTQGCNHPSIKDVWCGIGPSAIKIKVCCSCGNEVKTHLIRL